MGEERTMVLTMLQDGKISVDEAERLLKAMGDTQRSGGQRRETKRGGPYEFAFDWEPDFLGIGKKIQVKVKDLIKKIFDAIESGEIPPEFDPGAWFDRRLGTARANDSRELEVSASGVDRILLKEHSGSLSVQGEERNDILIHAQIEAWGATQEQAEGNAKSLAIEPVVAKDELSFRHGPGNDRDFRYSIDLDIRVPRSLCLDLSCTSGHISANSLSADVRLVSLSGDLSAADLTGPMHLITKSGSITSTDCNGSISVESWSGDVILRSPHGSVSAETKSGNILIEDGQATVTVKAMSGEIGVSGLATENVSAHTLSGDISARLNPDNSAKIKLRTADGDVRLQFPETLSGRLRARTISGDLECSLPLDSVHRDRRYLEGTIKSKQEVTDSSEISEIEIATASGDVSIGPL